MKKIIISLFLVMIVVVIGGKFTSDVVPNQVLSKVEPNNQENQEISFEESLANMDQDQLSWTTESEWNEDEFQATGGGVVDDNTFSNIHLQNFNVTGDLVQVKEDFFVSHMADIYLNAPKYLGKTIEYEGMFFSAHDEETGKTYKYVLRYGPGCCPYDDQVGLEVFCDETYPDETWVKISGELIDYQGEQYKHLVLSSENISEQTERGLETVFR